MSNPRYVDRAAAHSLLMGTEAQVGLFEEVLGFRTATGVIKPVHIMNDLAQTILGGAPNHGGDLLCRIIREGELNEPNSAEALRRDPALGPGFARAFSSSLRPHQVTALRTAIGLVLNFDAGLYAPGTSMASGLATHRDLLGFEGFRRFQIGPYLARTVAARGQARLARLFTEVTDPITQALRPLLWGCPLIDKQPSVRAPRDGITRFDQALGERLSRLLEQPLSKPTLLRHLALGAALGIALKILGAGRPDGRPLVLALAHNRDDGTKPLRAAATQALRRGVEALTRHLANRLPAHPLATGLYRRARTSKPSFIQITTTGEQAALQLLEGLREQVDMEPSIYWPDKFAVSLGRKVGAILPLSERAGWAPHLALTPDLVETLILMSLPPESGPLTWRRMWTELRQDIGLVVGVNEADDAEALRQVGVPHVSLEQLRANGDVLLMMAVRRDAARRLPDGGAEALGGSI